MATPQSSFIIQKYNGFGGSFVDSQYLGAAYKTGKPHVFENTLAMVFSSETNLFTGKLLTAMTGGKGSIGTKEIDSEIYRWTLQGAEEKYARVVENLESSNTTPGLNGLPFRLKLDLNYYHSPDVLFGKYNEYPLEIVEGPIADGTGFIYTVRIQGDNPSMFLPADSLEIGTEYCKVWTTVASEFNDEGGTQQYPDSFKLESQVGAFAQELTITDKAWRDEGKIAIEFMYTVDGKTKKATRFLAMAEAKMWDELYKSMEAQMVYGKKQTTQGPNGYWKKTGPGLREQLKDSWQEYYTGPLSVSDLKDFLLDIYVTRKDVMDRRTVGMTGTLGSQLWHDALVAISNGFLTVDTNFINKVASPVETPHLAYGAQFTRYNGPHGITVDLMVNPIYDSRKYCRQMHPQYPNLPIDSARITFLNLGTVGAERNLQMLKVKDTFYWGYVPGSWTPTGPVKGGAAGAHKNGYTMFTGGTAGLWMVDPSHHGEFIYAIED